MRSSDETASFGLPRKELDADKPARREYSSEDMSWAIKLVLQGHDVAFIARTLSKKPSGRRGWNSLKYGRLYEERGATRADEYARRTARNAVEFVKQLPTIRDPQAAIVRLLEIETAARSQPWGGGIGSSARRAFFGALLVGTRLNAVRFGLAWREWAELVGTDHNRLRYVVKSRLDGRWIQRNPADRWGRTSRWTLRTPVEDGFHIHVTPGDLNVETLTRVGWKRGDRDLMSPTRLLAHNAFVALGDDAWHVVDVSFAQWRMTTRRTIALATGMDAATLDHTLALLAQHGFLRQRGPYLVGPRDPSLVLDDLAFHLGTLGALDRLKAQHAADRSEWRAKQLGAGEM